MGHGSEPRAEEPADLRGAADATDAADAADAPDDPGETSFSPTTPPRLPARPLPIRGRDRSVTRGLESSDSRETRRRADECSGRSPCLHFGDARARWFVFLCQEDELARNSAGFNIPFDVVDRRNLALLHEAPLLLIRSQHGVLVGYWILMRRFFAFRIFS